MNRTGDLITVLYEPSCYYIVLRTHPRAEGDHSELKYLCLNLKTGKERLVPYSTVRVINKAKDYE